MCGIFGITYREHDRPVPEESVVAATDLMTHRGPDDAGYWVQPGVGLGHRRLSIIDLSPLGHQPMFNEDYTVGLVYNGEIYNYLELYRELTGKGHRFRSKTDTEVIIHAYEEWGFDCLRHFNGMFAFGLWDGRSRQLWVVRDRLGVKPLYYFWDGATFVFSSEVKPILAAGVTRAALNERVLDSFLTLGYVPGPETMFAGIMKLPPGSYLVVKEGRLTETSYWDFAAVEPLELSPGEYEERLEALLRDSISIRLRSDVPLGVFLSGGLDSSAVVALMSQMVTEPINTFTVGYRNTRTYSEEPFANMIASRFTTRHQLFQLEPEDFLSSVEKLVEFGEEPIVEPAAVALYRISQLARQSATVLLSGEGSDEILAGYYLYEIMRKIDSARGIFPAPLLRAARVAALLGNRLKLAKYGDWLNLSLESRYRGTSGFLTESMKRRLYDPGFFASRGSYLEETFGRLFDKVSHQPDTLSKMLYVDAKSWLVDDLLLKADKMTMAASIELRVPFLDYRLVELASSYPSAMKIDGGNGKAILKSIMRKWLPDLVVDRKKMGFPVPVASWFRGELQQALGSLGLEGEVRRWVNPVQVHELLNSRDVDGTRVIMTLLVLKAWKERYLGRS